MINGKVLYDSEDFDCDDLEYDDVLRDLFDNSDENNTYILVGNIDCGFEKDEPHVIEKTFDSVYEAIKHTYLKSDFEFKVVAYPYGVLHVETTHHDGVNDFEIRQLSDKGYNLHQHWWSIGRIIEKKGTTKNAHFKLN